MKIAILGFAGSGKSTLARELGERLGLPVCYLDRLFWLPGWQERPREEVERALAAFMDENDKAGWIIDGNYHNCLFERRMEEAGYILFLNFSRPRCLYRIIKRNIEYRGRSRFSMTEGCDEKLDWEFFKFAMFRSRVKLPNGRRETARRRYPSKFRELRSPRQLKKFLTGLYR